MNNFDPLMYTQRQWNFFNFNPLMYTETVEN